MTDEYTYSYEQDSYYCYPNAATLRNKLDIRDSEALMIAEREITAIRIYEIKENPVRGDFDLKHLQAIHGAIFSDIFEWAGKLRTVNIAKGNQFCVAQHLETYANGIFQKLKAENFLSDQSPAEISERLTYYLSEINVLHPFREGNGRTQRIFIEYLAKYAGYHVDFSQVDQKEMIAVSALSFACEYGRMNEMFERIITPISAKEREQFVKKIQL